MTLIEELHRRIQRDQPLRIDRVDAVDPTMTLVGSGWSLAIVCPWRLVLAGGEVIDWEQDGAEEAVAARVGQAIVGVKPLDSDHPTAPAFAFSNGDCLVIDPDDDLDPWSMLFDEITFVGTLSAPPDD